MNALTRHRILFVDDEPQWRDAASTSLAQAGFDVLTAADGSEAMRKAAAGPLALMIVDEDLAGEKGAMLARFLRYNHPGVPTILHTTAEHDADATLDLMSQTADQCLPKGSMEELIVNVGCFVR
jgi:two-component system OmpR family response regulator